MKIAVIGGGAAGIMTAHLLDEAHDVSLFEKQALLGGNIRTLGKNLPFPTQREKESSIFLDSGVIEFERTHNPVFDKLLKSLNVETEPVNIHVSISFANGKYFQSLGMVLSQNENLWRRFVHFLKLFGRGFEYMSYLKRVKKIPVETLSRIPYQDLLKNDIYSQWMTSLITYSYSLETRHAKQVPAELALDILRTYRSPFLEWFRIKGGVYSYVEKILHSFSGDVHLGSQIQTISRNEKGVTLHLEDGKVSHFDKVVFATTPDQVLPLLETPTKEEELYFKNWKVNQVEVQVHTDTDLYKKRKIKTFTEFDFIEIKPREFGYNAYLNRLCGVPTKGPTQYSLSFNIDKEINPETIIHRQNHYTPLYRPSAFQHRQKIKDHNGDHHTYHAGSYLYDGLHGGAAKSAHEVSKKLGGKILV